MKKQSASIELSSHAYLVIASDKAVELCDGFTELTRFSNIEMHGRDIGQILDMLRVQPAAAEQLNSAGRAECYLFTKDLEPREVTISRSKEESGDTRYTFEEKPSSRLEEVLCYPCQLIDENMVGVSIYSVPDFILLKANQIYLDFADKPFDNPENTIGRTLYDFIESYRGSLAEERINNIFITGKSEVLKEIQFDIFKRGITYWDQIITPVKVDGKVKYIVTNTQEVTERVLARKQLDEQNKLLEHKKTELTAIIENMTDALLIFDKDGKYTTLNKAARELFLPLAPGLNEIEDARIPAQFFDFHGDLIPPEENPPLRVKRGEVLHNVRIGIKKESTMVYNDVNGIPLYDEKGHFSAGIISCRDVTAQVNSEKQYRQLYQTMQSGVVHHNAEGMIISMNPAAENILGKSMEEIARSYSITAQPYRIKEDGTMLPETEHPAMVALQTGAPTQDTVMGIYNPRKGAYRWININAVPLFRPGDSRPYQVFTVFDDITEQKKAEDALMKSEARLRTVLDNSNDVIYSLNVRTKRHEYVSPSCLKLLGYTPEDFMTIDIEQTHAMVHPDDFPAFKATLQTIDERGEVELHYRQRTKSGEYRWVSNRVSVVRDEDGRVLYRNGNIHDITEQVNNIAERKKMEDALRESEMRLRFVLENSSDVIYSLNMLTNRYEYVSPSYEKLMGYSAEEIMAMDTDAIIALIHPEDQHAVRAMLAESVVKDTVEMHFRQLRRNGEYRWLSNRMSVVRDEAGRLLYRFGNIHDITEQVENDAVIRYQANLLQNISNMVISTDDNLMIKSWNKAAELRYGWTEAEVIGHNVRRLLQAEVVGASFEDKLGRLIEQGKVEFEVIHTCKDGRKINALNTLVLLKNSDGRFTGTVGIFHDITERKIAENALRESEMRLRLAAEGAGIGTYSYNFVTRKEFWSVELKALWGIGPDEPIQLGSDLLYIGLHPDDKQDFLRRRQAAEDPEGDGVLEMEYRIIQPNGTMKWLHVKGQTTFAGEGENRHPIYAAGVVFDITKKVDADNSIREISEELRNIIESTDDFIWSVDRDFKLVLYNSSFEQYIQSRFKRRLKKGLLMKDILTPEDGALWEDFYLQTASEGKFQIEMRIDQGSRVMSYAFNPVYIDSELIEITVFGKDITERINSEREIIRLNTSLEKRVSERTEELQKSVSSLQHLSRIISHDLKEPIREIEAYANQIVKNADVRSNSLKIRQVCNNMTSTIEDLSRYAMSSDYRVLKETVNIKKIVTSIYSDLKSTMTNSSVLQFESGLPLVYADKVLIRQVLYNLMSNALKFSSKRELAEITVGCVEENGHYVFYIRDNGIGFDMQYAHKLFSIFERLHTKEEFEGTGIGLAAVRNIIQRHEGRVWIESKQDMGTTVYFSLPVPSGK